MAQLLTQDSLIFAIDNTLCYPTVNRENNIIFYSAYLNGKV